MVPALGQGIGCGHFKDSVIAKKLKVQIYIILSVSFLWQNLIDFIVTSNIVS